MELTRSYPCFAPLAAAPPPRVEKLNPPTKLHLEALEDRSAPAAIYGVAFFDHNLNGIRDLEDGPIQGVGVALSPMSGSPASATSDASGFYTFTGLGSGSYQLNYTPPTGYVVNTPVGGSTTVAIGTDDVGVGVGLIPSGSGSGSGSGEHWISTASTDWTTPTNWSRGRVPVYSDHVYFDIVGTVSSTNAGAGLTALTGLHILSGYTQTLTLANALSIGTLEMSPGAGGKIDQPSSGLDLTITTALNWTTGTINSTSNPANLIISGASALIAPANGGVVNTGSTIKFLYSALGTFRDGHVNFIGGDGVEVNANCSVEFAAASDDIVFSKDNAGQDAKKVWIKTGGTATVPGPKNFLAAIPLLNEGGTFTVKGGVTASFEGSIGPKGQAAAFRQTAGTLVIENGSSLWADAYLSGGKLSTAARTTPGDAAFVARILTGPSKSLTIAGATVEIGDSAYDKPGTGHTFSTLAVDGNVVWTSGAARFSFGWNANDTRDSDEWHATGTFTMTGGANGAKLGPRASVNVGTHNQTGESRWLLYGEKGTTISNNATALDFELAAQGNDWSNILGKLNPNDTFYQLKLSHK